MAAVEITYDGEGLRVQKSNGAIYWRSISGDTLAESDASGNITNEYGYFDGRIAARRDSSSNVYFFFADHLGSTRVVTNSTGTPCYEADYYPYGGELTPSGFTNTCPTNYRFTGYERDPETSVGGVNGLDYAMARYYDSRIGRFMSPDPVDGNPGAPQSWNAYTYTVNNPLSAVDPEGLDPVDATVILTNLSGGGSLTIFGDPFGPFGSLGGVGGIGGIPGPMSPALWNSWTFRGFMPLVDFRSELTAAMSGHVGPPAGPPQIGTWSFGLQGSGTALWKELGGVCNATACGLYSMVRHPINTAVGLMTLAAAMPNSAMGYGGDIGAQMQIYEAASAWGHRLADYDPTAFGEAVGTVASLAYGAENVRVLPYESGGGGANLFNTPTRGSRIAADWAGKWKGGSGFHFDITIKRIPGGWRFWEEMSGPGSNWFKPLHHWQPWK